VTKQDREQRILAAKKRKQNAGAKP